MRNIEVVNNNILFMKMQAILSIYKDNKILSLVQRLRYIPVVVYTDQQTIEQFVL